MSEPIKLKRPIKRGEKDLIDHLTLREPTSGDLRGVKLFDLLQLDVDALCKVVPRIASPLVTEAEIRSLKMADLARLGTGIVSFLGEDEELSPSV